MNDRSSFDNGRRRNAASEAAPSATPRVFRLFPQHHAECNEPTPLEVDDELSAAVPRFRAITGLVFDMGDVLFDATAWRLGLLQLLRRLGLQAGYRSLFELWDRDYLDAVHRGERDYAEAFTAFLRAAGLSPGQVDEVVVVSQRIKRQCETEVRLFPGVRETLERLRSRGMRLAVLSDSESPATAISARLQRLGIGDAFTTVVSSVDLRRTKPHPLGYLTAVEGIGLRAEQTAFVGHDADELNGARRCGMRTIAYNHDRGTSADCRIPHFGDLTRLLFPPTDTRDVYRDKAA